jgi:hypothetical protein
MQNEWNMTEDDCAKLEKDCEKLRKNCQESRSIDDITTEEWDRMSKTFIGKLHHPQDKHDPVAQPDHYNKGAIEAIEAIKASMHPQEYKGYLKGNCLKYLWRYEYKNGIEDLRKARVYLEWLIKEVAL